MSAKLRVLLVDDQILFRKALCSVLADWGELQVAGEAASGAEAVAKALDLRPDIILMDIHMPGMDGLDATRLIRRDMPEAKIVMLTVSEQDDHLFESIKLGAQGYLLKNVTAVMLREMLTAVARGEAPISPLMASKILSEFVQRVPFMTLRRPEEELTPREKEVLTLVAGGVDNGLIAERLCLAPGTVKRHMHNILAKLHARNRAEAAACGLHYRLISATSRTQK